MSDIEPDPHAAFLEYVGITGATKECQEAIVKSGFSSGYVGTGPKGFSAVLDLLHWHRVELDEALVDADLLTRLDGSSLTLADRETIRVAPRPRPQRLWDYLTLDREDHIRDRNPWKHRGLNVPMAIIDDRLAEMARDFWKDPDGMLFKGHRKLEETVRERAGITIEEATKGPSATYTMAFNGEAPRLSWLGISRSKHAGRTNIFVGAMGAYRNVRAHRTDNGSNEDRLCELLLLNHLFRLEAAAVRTASADQTH